MRISTSAVLVFAPLLLIARRAGQTAPGSNGSLLPPPSPGSEAGVTWERRPVSEHVSEWVNTEQSTDPTTGRVLSRTRRVVELATGQNYLDEQGQWQITREQFELTPQGAVARFGPSKVIIASNLNTPGAVDILSPGGRRLRLHLIGLSYYDSQLAIASSSTK